MIDIISQQLATSQIHPVVVDWARFIVANGGTVSSKTVTAANTFYDTLQTNGLISLMKSVNIVAPDSLIAFRTPLITTSGSGIWANSPTPFVAADLSLSGIKGGVNKYLNMGIKPGQVVSSGNAGLVCYVVSGFQSSNNVEAGITDAGGGNRIGIACQYTTTNQTWWSMWGNEGLQLFTDIPKISGYFAGFRTSVTRFDCYHGTTQSGHNLKLTNLTSSSLTPSTTQNIVFMATNENGSIQQSSQKIVSFFALTLGLSSGQSLILYNAVKKLRMDIGGGWV